MPDVINVADVTKEYGTAVKTLALRGVSFRVESKEFLSIIGQSGSGKSTLLNLLGLLDTPKSGTVELLGALPVGLADRLVSATVSPEGEISLQLSPNLSIIFGQPSEFQVKLVAVDNEMKRQGSRSYTVIDVSTGEPTVQTR